jgi:hypothetical protein
MAAKQPLSFKKIADAIDAVEASIQAATASPADAKAKKQALRVLEDLRRQVKDCCKAPKGKKGGPAGPEFIAYRGV